MAEIFACLQSMVLSVLLQLDTHMDNGYCIHIFRYPTTEASLSTQGQKQKRLEVAFC